MAWEFGLVVKKWRKSGQSASDVDVPPPFLHVVTHPGGLLGSAWRHSSLSR